jgi:hypothetical protein
VAAKRESVPMARRRKKKQDDIELVLVGLGMLVIFSLAIAGLLRAVLLGILALGLLALAVFVFAYIFKYQTSHPRSGGIPPIPSRPPPLDVDVTCPLCKAILTAPASIAGQTVCCEGCRHVFELPKPAITLPDATSFYFPPKSKGFTPQLLSELEWKRFENLVEGYFSAIGLKTRPNRPGADGGVDIHLLHPDTNQVGSIVQCKSWHVYDVGVKPVRELYGVMAADHIPEGVFVTTGDYTAEARSFAAGKQLTLIDGRDLLARLAALPSEKQASLLAAITAGDYKTPTCPRCGIKMVRRQNKKQLLGSSAFWGCPSYPRCRQTFPIKKDR